MTKESEPKRGLHQRMGASVDGVEEDRIDELLELIWTLREEGVSDMDHLLGTTRDIEANSILRKMIKDDLFQIDGNRMALKERGEEKAREIVRRHRLTERLLYEIFEMSEEEVEEEEKPGDVELGLESMVDKYGLQKVIDTVARMSKKE